VLNSEIHEFLKNVHSEEEYDNLVNKKMCKFYNDEKSNKIRDTETKKKHHKYIGCFQKPHYIIQ
jgi:hypothetical protein